MQSCRKQVPMALVCYAVALFSGCSATDRIATYPVSGTIVYPDGSPLAAGSILVHCGGESPPARAAIGDDGTFTLGTYETGDGAPAGVHPVAIFPGLPADYNPDSNRRLPTTIKQKYQQPDTSGITIEVKPNEKNYFEITVERAVR